MRIDRALAPLLLPTLLSACLADAPQQYQVPDLRILAVRDWIEPSVPPPPPPYADASEPQTVRLEALVANPRGRAAPGGTAPTVDWYACQAIFGDAYSPCTSAEALRDLDAFTGLPGVVLLAAATDASSGIASASLDLVARGAALGVPGAIDEVVAASADPAQQCTLYAEIPLVAIARAAGVAPEPAVKRVRLHPVAELVLSGNPNQYRLNRNPEIESIDTGASDPEVCDDGTPVDGLTLAGDVELCGALMSSSIEQYSLCDPRLPGGWMLVPEEIAWQWYVTAGTIEGASFDGNVTDRWITLRPPAGSFTLWLIARDGQGGTAWKRWDRVVVP